MATEHPALGFAYGLAGAPPARLSATQSETRDTIVKADRPEHYEAATCPCGATAGDRLLSEVDRHGLACRNVICLGCGLIRLTPRWREDRYREFYESEYRRLYSPSATSKARYAREAAENPATRTRAAWVEREARSHGAPANARLVEIGAGAGWNLAHLPAGWNRLGYDVDEEYLAIGAASFGAEMRYGFVDEALSEIAAADIVLLSHVVEHFSNPSGILQAIGRRLRPNALLLIEVPGIFRIHSTNLDVRSYLQNAHTFTYCATTLADECRRAGLQVLAVDETARVICRSGGSGSGVQRVRTGLAARIIRYLRLCDSGHRYYHRLRRLPGIGRAASALWKRTYFASLGALVPRAR